MTKIINLFAGPGSGKSTTAAGLFYELKRRNIKCELVTEYAKDMVWENRDNILADQLYLLAKQNRRITRLLGKVDYIITDSPILQGIVYMEGSEYSEINGFLIRLIKALFHKTDNLNYFIHRDKPYLQYGRNQTGEEAKKLDKDILELLDRSVISYAIINMGPEDIITDLQNRGLLT